MKTLSIVVAALAISLSAGCVGLPGRLGPTSLVAQAQAPAQVSPRDFWVAELYPPIVTFQVIGDAASQVDIGDLAPFVADMVSSQADLKEIEASKRVPACARPGLAKIVGGEKRVLESWQAIAGPGCIYDTVCTAKADQAVKSGQAMLDAGAAQVESDCGIQ